MTIQFTPKLVVPLLVGFSVFFLYCSAAYAEKRIKQKLNTNLTKQVVTFKVSLPAIDESSKFAYPAITSEVYNKYKNINVKQASQTSQQPMVGIKVADFSSIVPRKLENKNSFFEFAAKFNDKLQQVIAYFNFSSKAVENKDNNKDINQKRKVSFIIESVN